MSTCNWLHLPTLGSQPVMPKNLLNHCPGRTSWRLVTDEPVDVQDCRKTTDYSRGIERIFPNSIENQRM